MIYVSTPNAFSDHSPNRPVSFFSVFQFLTANHNASVLDLNTATYLPPVYLASNVASGPFFKPS